jgi:non-ribosomal peptide synthetase component F
LLVPFSARVSDADALLKTFIDIVKQIAASPDTPLSSLISAPTTISIDRTTHDEVFGLAHSAFEKCAATDPSRPAIRTKSGELSYGDFNTRAEDFAQHLMRVGVKHGEMIPIYMEKSEETLVTIFGILKAGAAFVPLDPHNPYARNKFIIGDINAVRIITDETNREFCAAFDLPIILYKDILVADTLVVEPVPVVSPDSIAYAIYTSGSTGLPKGVLVPHSAVDAATRGMIGATGVTRDWTALWVLNYIFDASYYDVFTVFSTGALLCVVPQDELLSDLAGTINNMAIKQVMLTPTITKLIRGGPSQVPDLKVLNVCGEKIDTNILQWASHIDVYNGFVSSYQASESS